MSARFYKIFAAVFMGHVVVLSMVWVGFTVPLPKPPATFTYEGELSLETAAGQRGQAWQKGGEWDQFVVDHQEGSDSNHWIRLRGLAKSLTYDHLGF